IPVVHSSASVFRTEGVLSGHGPSSNVSTTSLSRRKSSCLKCSKPNPGPPVVSISTTRPIPSASGLEQLVFVGDGATEARAATEAAGADAPAAARTCGGGAANGSRAVAEGSAARAWTAAGCDGRGAAVCSHAALAAQTETVTAKTKPARNRIEISPYRTNCGPTYQLQPLEELCWCRSWLPTSHPD